MSAAKPDLLAMSAITKRFRGVVALQAVSLSLKPVLRDGRHVGDLTRAEATHEKIVAMMVGRELSAHYFPEKRPRRSTEPVLVVEGLVVPRVPAPVSFSAERGKILGFAGLVGSGRTELMQTVFGVTPALGGRMTLVVTHERRIKGVLPRNGSARSGSRP
ncbi:hypothetical protein [Sorangium sp. So ce233]|uniref:hypothetical protein n=1 Tax=Sorangium sp. So ce233 TaxID=3133290 RepID=UPI003F5EB42B